MAKAKSRFKLAVGLWVSPDFKAAMADGSPPPRLDHSKVNFSALRDALQEEFTAGPPVEIRVPNDTVDQVTIQLRAGIIGGGPPDLEAASCADFGRAMLNRTDLARQSCVIDVLTAWRSLHAQPIRDRNFAPPPSLLPFVVIADDFEDAMIWQASTRPYLGLPAFDVAAAIRGVEQQEGGGTMSAGLQEKLKKVLGCPFEATPTMLSRLASDPLPDDYDIPGYR